MKRPESDNEKYARHCEAIAAASDAVRGVFASIADKHASDAEAVERSGGDKVLAIETTDEGTEREGTRYSTTTGEPLWQAELPPRLKFDLAAKRDAQRAAWAATPSPVVTAPANTTPVADAKPSNA